MGAGTSIFTGRAVPMTLTADPSRTCATGALPASGRSKRKATVEPTCIASGCWGDAVEASPECASTFGVAGFAAAWPAGVAAGSEAASGAGAAASAIGAASSAMAAAASDV